MKLFNSASELRSELDSQRCDQFSIGLVPTMGNLHRGHLRLVEEAVSTCDYVVTTIFVNPLQFGPDEDLQAYPRSFEDDKAKLIDAGCHCLFSPDVNEIFGSDLESQTILHIPELSEKLCGKSRPGHFDGVATIVCKLFNTIAPHAAFFGLKDYQQFLIIQKLIRDLNFNIELVGIEIEREDNGLALSSRNSYLSAEELTIAASIYHCLTKTADKIRAGQCQFSELEQAAREELQAAGLIPDYFQICNAENLEAAQQQDSTLAILAAAYLGNTRLIDNLRVSL